MRRDGQVLDVLLDAEVSPAMIGNIYAYAAIRDSHDSGEWRQASTTMRALQELASVQSKLQDILSSNESTGPEKGALTTQQQSGSVQRVSLASETLGSALESARDISATLRTLVQLEQERQDATVEQQRELLQVARSIEKTLADLADTAAEIRGQSK